MRYWLLTLTVFSVFITGQATAQASRVLSNRPRWLPKIWWAIGMCETGLNWRHNSGTYQGAFGFYYGAWDQFRPRGYPSEAYNATPWQQYQVALRIYRRFGFSGWGCVTNGGYQYWMRR